MDIPVLAGSLNNLSILRWAYPILRYNAKLKPLMQLAGNIVVLRSEGGGSGRPKGPRYSAIITTVIEITSLSFQQLRCKNLTPKLIFCSINE